MTIKALPEPCFIDGGDVNGFHGTDGRSLDEPSRLAAPCFVAVCDGIPGQPCGEVFSSADYDELHFDSAEQAQAALRVEGWEWLAIFAAARCPQCTDDLAASVVMTTALGSPAPQ